MDWREKRKKGEVRRDKRESKRGKARRKERRKERKREVKRRESRTKMAKREGERLRGPGEQVKERGRHPDKDNTKHKQKRVNHTPKKEGTKRKIFITTSYNYLFSATLPQIHLCTAWSLESKICHQFQHR